MSALPVHFTEACLTWNRDGIPYCGGSWMHPANFAGRLSKWWRLVTCRNCRAKRKRAGFYVPPAMRRARR